MRFLEELKMIVLVLAVFALDLAITLILGLVLMAIASFVIRRLK